MNPPDALIEDLRLLEPPNPWLIYYVAAGVIGALLLFVLIRFLVKRRRRPRRRVTNSTVRAAQAEALAALERIHPLIQEGEGRVYAMECSAVVRDYIELRFGVRARMRSTDEFLREAQHASGLVGDFQPLLERFFRRCDMLKFARGVASQSELEELHTVATRFVRETRARRQESHR